MSSERNRETVGSNREGVMTATSIEIEQARQQERELREVGEAFLDTLGRRDFEAFKALIHPRARMRSLEWAGHFDRVGRDEIVDAFRGWFSDLDADEVVSTALSVVGQRLHVGYHYRVRLPGHDGLLEVEQHVYFQVRNGRVLSLDLLCSGYIPASALLGETATTVAA